MTGQADRFGVFPGLHITVDALPQGTVRIRIAGELTVENADQFSEVVRQVVDDRHATSVEVDLSLVTFMDSTGIGRLVSGRTHARNGGSDLWIVQPSPQVRRVLSLVGMLDILETRGWIPPRSA